ncbi:hypothetical protein ABZ914_10045 [Spirillospora sp. NPDC046719]
MAFPPPPRASPGGRPPCAPPVRGFVGESMAVRRLEQTTARLLLPPGDG